MALVSPEAGNYFEWDQVANSKSLVVFRVRAVPDSEPIHNRQTGKDSTVWPVIVDFCVLDGPFARTVGRNEKVIKGKMTASIRRVPIGDDGVYRVKWIKNEKGPGEVIAAIPVDSTDMAFATDVFAKTGNDPYTAAELAAKPAGATLSTPAPPAAQAYQQPAAPAQPPAADAPAPWGQGGNTGGNAPAAVGGPQGPGWGESPAATNAQPVASGSVW